MRRMAANTGRAMPGEAAEAPWEVEARARKEAEAKAAAKPAVMPGGGQQLSGGPGSSKGIWQGFKGRGGFMGRIPGMMNRARQAAQAKQRGPAARPGRRGFMSRARNAALAKRGGAGMTGSPKSRATPTKRTGALGGTLGRSPRSRGLRGRGIGGRGFGGGL